jgi:predicted nucleic acid-binding protein
MNDLVWFVDTGYLVALVSERDKLHDRALTFYAARPDKDWGLADCISFVVMQDQGIHGVLVADRDFVQAGYRALLID